MCWLITYVVDVTKQRFFLNLCIRYDITNKTCIFLKYAMYGLALGQYTILALTPQSVNFHIALNAMFYVNCRSIVKHTVCVFCKSETNAAM